MTSCTRMLNGDDKCGLAWAIVAATMLAVMAACFATWGGLNSDLTGHICTISNMREFTNVMNGDSVNCEMTVDVSISGCDINNTMRVLARRSCETYDPWNLETTFPLYRDAIRYGDASYTCYTRKAEPCAWNDDYYYNYVYAIWVAAWVFLVAFVIACVPAAICGFTTRFSYCIKWRLARIRRNLAARSEMGANGATVRSGDDDVSLSSMSTQEPSTLASAAINDGMTEGLSNHYRDVGMTEGLSNHYRDVGMTEGLSNHGNDVGMTKGLSNHGNDVGMITINLNY
ncbi:hypothetical protein PRJ_Dakar_00026 [Faustovirus]|nr:hypothetical protein PRJ_Dakar_00026 [Faustovirus]